MFSLQEVDKRFRRQEDKKFHLFNRAFRLSTHSCKVGNAGLLFPSIFICLHRQVCFQCQWIVLQIDAENVLAHPPRLRRNVSE